MDLEGQKNKASDEFLLVSRGSIDEEGGRDNNKTTAMVESRIKAGNENETNYKGNKGPKVKAPNSINAKKQKQPKVTKVKALKKPESSKSKNGVKPTAPESVVIVELSLPPLDLILDNTDGSGEIDEATL